VVDVHQQLHAEYEQEQCGHNTLIQAGRARDISVRVFKDFFIFFDQREAFALALASDVIGG
jgi:hypothetical protein